MPTSLEKSQSGILSLKKKLFNSGYYLKLFLFLLPVPFLWIAAHHQNYLKSLEDLALNKLYQLRGPIDSPVKLIYVDVDAKAINLMGERPFPRIFYAEVVNALFNYGHAKAIGIDIVFSDAAQSFLTDAQKIAQDNENFRQVIQSHPNLVLAAAYTPRINELSTKKYDELTEFPFLYRGYTDPDNNALPEQPGFNLLGMRGNVAIINVDEGFSPSSIARWVPTFAKTPGPTYYTMAAELARIYYDQPKDAYVLTDSELSLKSNDGQTFFTIPLIEGQLVEVNWFSKFFSDKNPRFSMADVLLAIAWMHEGAPIEKQKSEEFFNYFKNAIILIGPVDPLLQDLAPTSMDSEPVPKVGIHGNLLKTIFAGEYITRLSERSEYLITLVLTFLISFLALNSFKYSGASKVVSGFVLIAYGVMAFYLFTYYNIIIPFITPIGSSTSTAFIGLILKLLQEEKQRSRIKNMFGTYVSPALVSQMVESEEEPQLGGVEEYVTAFFSDVQNFSTFSEKLSPSELVELMNEYLTEMTNIIQEHGGTLDKYIGDAIVAIYGAPVKLADHAYRACITSCHIQRKQAELRQLWSQRSGEHIDLIASMQTRIGLNTGLATVGNMGSKTRFNYTMMGDTVNLAARCESGAKSYGIYTMITGTTKEEAEKYSQDLCFRFIDKIIVKGRTAPESVYELVATRKDIVPETQSCLDLFDAGMKFYLNKDWSLAISKFEEASRYEINQPGKAPGVSTNPSLVFIERCHYMQKTPPPDNWDGVYTMTTK